MCLSDDCGMKAVREWERETDRGREMEIERERDSSKRA